MKKTKIFIFAFLFFFLLSGIAFGGWSGCKYEADGAYEGGQLFFLGNPGHCGTYNGGKGIFATPWGPVLMYTANHNGWAKARLKWLAPWPQNKYVEVKPNEEGKYKIRVQGEVLKTCNNVVTSVRDIFIYFYLSRNPNFTSFAFHDPVYRRSTRLVGNARANSYQKGVELDLTQAYQKIKVRGRDIYYLYAANSHGKDYFIIKMPLKFLSYRPLSFCTITADVFPPGAGRVSVDISRYTCGDKNFSVVTAFPYPGYKFVGFDLDLDSNPDSLTQTLKLSHDQSWHVTAIFKRTAAVFLTSDLTSNWIWQTKPLTLTWNSRSASQCRRWIEVWNPFENVKLKDTSLGDTIPYDNWTSDWNDELSGTITTYPGSGPPDPQTGTQPRNWIGKLWIYKIKCKDSEGDEVETSLEINVKPRPIWEEVSF